MNTRQRDADRGRRAFLKGVGAAGLGAVAAPWMLPSGVLGAQAAPPSRKLNVAAIGTGGRCRALMQEVLRHGENLVALCDVDQNQLASARKFVAKVEGGGESADKASVYEDYRKLLDSEKSLDAVLVAAGARWHAPVSALFMKAGKHVYCEKPLVRKIAEARELSELTRTCKVATQTGTQGCGALSTRRAIEVLRAGVLGPIREVYLWCDGYGPNPPSHDAPPGEDPVPPGLNWDFWLGPVPLRPFKRGIYLPGCLAFQNWLPLDNGMLAGQGAHTFPLPVLGLDLGHPTRVETELPEPLKETYPSKAYFRFEFAARGNLPPVTLWWSDGGRYPPEHVTQSLKAASGKVPNMGSLFLGEQGQLHAGGWGGHGILKLKGDKNWRGVLDHEAAKAVPVTLPRIPGDNHMAEWLEACKGGPATFTGFDVGGRISEVYLPGSLALRLGRAIEWDGAAMKVTGAPEADPLIHKHYRTRWL